MSNKELEKLASKFIEKIYEKYKVKFAYLFGSRARGEEKNESDIDLGIYFKQALFYRIKSEKSLLVFTINEKMIK